MNLQDIGLTQEELQARLVEHIADRLLTTQGVDQYENEVIDHSSLQSALKDRIQTAIDDKITALANEHVIPKVDKTIEEICLQTTNKWGEKKGEPMSFVEYLVQQAEAYIQEPVSYEGKTKKESAGYSWSAKTTRISYAIDKYLQYSMEKMMKEALASANESIAGGIQEAVKLSLQEVTNKLKVKVST